MSYLVHLASDINGAEWDRFVRCQKNGSYYHTWAWREVLNSRTNLKPLYLYVINESGQWLGVLPAFVITNLLGARIESLPFSMYGGIAAKETGAAMALLQGLLQQAQDRRINKIVVKSTQEDDLCLYEQLGFKNLQISTRTLLDISGEAEQLWKQFPSMLKRQIKKAQKSLLKFEIITNEAQLAELYHLQLLTRKRQGLPTHSFEYYQQMFNVCYPENGFWGVLCRKGPIAVSGAIFFVSGESLIYALGASDFRFRSYCPNDFMFWETILWAKERGFKQLDFGGTGINHESLLAYKKKWGGVHIPYATFCFGGAESATGNSQLLKRLLNIFIRKIPISWAARLGSFLIRLAG